MRKLSSNPLYMQVFDQIKSSIRLGVYQKGQILPSEKELMEQTGVSRVTVRQALRMLAEAGIIETQQGKGSRVIMDWKELLNPGEMRDHLEECWKQFELSSSARRMIEPALAKQAAIVATQEDIERLKRVQEHPENIMMEISGYSMEDGEENQSFHRCLWDILKNPLMDQVWEAIVVPSGAMRSLPLIVPAQQQKYREEIRRQHEQIFHAIQAHDSEYAYYHMLMHCDWIYQVYKQYFEEFCC